MIVSDKTKNERKKLLIEVLHGTIAMSHPNVSSRLRLPKDSPDFVSIRRPIFEDQIMIKSGNVLTYRPRQSPYAPVLFDVLFPMPIMKNKYYTFGVVAIEGEWRPVSPSNMSFIHRRQASHQYLRMVR